MPGCNRPQISPKPGIPSTLQNNKSVLRPQLSVENKNCSKVFKSPVSEYTKITPTCFREIAPQPVLKDQQLVKLKNENKKKEEQILKEQNEKDLLAAENQKLKSELQV